MTNRNAPVLVMPEVTAISAGRLRTMILKTDGTLWVTGMNPFREFSSGAVSTISLNNAPRQVMSGVASVSAGNGHTTIVKTDGTLWATGGNEYGQLGDGTTITRNTPVQVM